MSTVTAYHRRPEVLQPAFVTLELVPALPEDFKEFDCWVDTGNGNKQRKMKIRNGLIYWLKSPSTLQIKPTPFKLDEHTNLEDIAEYFKNDMVFISKNPFND